MPDGWGAGGWGVEPWGSIETAPVDLTFKTVTYAPALALAAGVGGVSEVGSYSQQLGRTVTYAAAVGATGSYASSVARTGMNQPSIAKAGSP